MEKPEVWMRGPIPEIPALLQPVAHALLQAQEDIISYLDTMTEESIWIRPDNSASVAFHVEHIIGVIDRMFTYARMQPLREEQFAYLRSEGKKRDSVTIALLLQHLDAQISKALEELKQTAEPELTATRYIGRKQIPTTLIGLLFHAAEHAQRHVGQLLVTTRWVNNSPQN